MKGWNYASKTVKGTIATLPRRDGASSVMPQTKSNGGEMSEEELKGLHQDAEVARKQANEAQAAADDTWFDTSTSGWKRVAIYEQLSAKAWRKFALAEHLLRQTLKNPEAK